MAGKSGLQTEVLALYRALLRQAATKDRSTGSNNTLSFAELVWNASDAGTTVAGTSSRTATSHARNEFRRQAAASSRKDFRGIEHKIRHGYKQIKLLQMPGVVYFRSWK
mmetsp:Transcript_2411/g.6471  ORF Transcript_2411/g.6471 Transcript_2411/m.6471 type:complete len:109 (-) Transcript_2411:831-1157(-)|eukprot:CAMPEP_0172377012 /NCGR_PEP_ID=MMETSP1060-20121228/68680_1 /TAXON_ID=37318 /ORGANISM="Pseudo-nitzschia pungens, Strain cf. cingulata" /LENGTH=108 /DNA_ID=CAMNT_0013104679 /DNA_START=194 /DNA_END=520 /DNA_ORIENTATION=-